MLCTGRAARRGWRCSRRRLGLHPTRPISLRSGIRLLRPAKGSHCLLLIHNLLLALRGPSLASRGRALFVWLLAWRRGLPSVGVFRASAKVSIVSWRGLARRSSAQRSPVRLGAACPRAAQSSLARCSAPCCTPRAVCMLLMRAFPFGILCSLRIGVPSTHFLYPNRDELLLLPHWRIPLLEKRVQIQANRR